MPRAKPSPDLDDVQLQIRLPQALHARLRRRAFQERRSLASIARLGIEQYLKPKRREAEAPLSAQKSRS